MSVDVNAVQCCERCLWAALIELVAQVRPHMIVAKHCSIATRESVAEDIVSKRARDTEARLVGTCPTFTTSFACARVLALRLGGVG